MHAIDTSTAVNGQFTDGDPLAGIPPTELDAAWANDLQGNVLFVLQLAKLAAVRGDYTQLGRAIQALITAAVANEAPAPAAPGGGVVVDQVGPYGMPTRAAMPAADANSLVKSGFYACGAGSANMPAGATSGVILCGGNTDPAGDGGQVYVDVSGRAWARGRSDGAWGAWVAANAAAKRVALSVNGYAWDPSTGELRQWGYVQGSFSEGVVNVPFQVQFDTCFGCRGWVTNTSADISIGTWIDEVSVGAASAQLLVNRVSAGSDNIPGFKWEAHGVAATFVVANQGGGGSQSGSGGSGSSGGSGGGSGGVQP